MAIQANNYRVRFGASEEVQLRAYAAALHCPVSTLVRAIVRDQLVRAEREGRLELELGSVNVAAVRS